MEWAKGPRKMNSTNDYSRLKWPIGFASIFTTILALILLLAFRSNVWFTYEITHRENNNSVNFNLTRYSRLLEYGSVGLWKSCIGHYDEPKMTCDSWTKENRPHSFNVLIVLVSCALFLANLTVFPSWATSILILYNTHNRYIHPILAFIWILLILTFSFTILLLVTMLLSTLSRFYAPGVFTSGTQHIFFHTGPGLVYTSFGE